MARRLGLANVITLRHRRHDGQGGADRGTARVAYSAEYEVGASLSAGNRLVGGGGELIRAPSIDIAEVGAGGGSIAYLDRAGGLRVGPRSAGAVPGPACYGRGGNAAHRHRRQRRAWLYPPRQAGRWRRSSIDREAAERAIHDHIAGPLGMDLLQRGRGHSPHRQRPHACGRCARSPPSAAATRAISRCWPSAAPARSTPPAWRASWACARVIVPPLPGLFSAVGLLLSGVEHHDCAQLPARRRGADRRRALAPIGAELRAAHARRAFEARAPGAEQVDACAGAPTCATGARPRSMRIAARRRSPTAVDAAAIRAAVRGRARAPLRPPLRSRQRQSR